MKQYGFTIALTTVLLVLLVVTEYNRPQAVDKRRTYSKADKIPYGNFILHDLLSDLFPKQAIKVVRQPIYEQLKDQDSIVQTNYIFIQNYINPDSLETQLLLDYVARGNTVFAATQQISGYLEDTLQMESLWDYGGFLKKDQQDSLTVNFTHPKLQTTTGYPLPKSLNSFYISVYDTARTQVLGINQEKKVVFIKTNWGKGAFYIHVLPEIFSNYYMIHKNMAEYISKTLSHLPVTTVYWDEYYKKEREGPETILRYVLSQPPLKWAWYIGLGAILLYLLFEGKRRQRIIPLIPPIVNTTVAFTKTVADLYYKSNNHKDMAEKKIRYFLEHIRQKYFFRKTPLTPDFLEALAQKSGVDLAEVRKMGQQIQMIQSKQKISESELQQLNKYIDNFYKIID